MHVAELGIDGNMPSLFYGDGTYCGLMVDFGQNLISTPLLTIVLKTMAPSQAISNIPTHQISVATWEKLLILN